MSQDPIGFAGGLNLFTYVENNPVNWVDPGGLEPKVGWMAQLTELGIRKVGDALNFRQLVEAVKAGEDVICKSKTLAKEVATAAGDGKNPVGPERHRARNPRRFAGQTYQPYRGHYHMHGRPNIGHIFYGMTAPLNLLGSMVQLQEIQNLGGLLTPQPIFDKQCKTPRTEWSFGSGLIPLPQTVYPDNQSWRDYVLQRSLEQRT